MRIGVIDVGSNTMRLLVAAPAAGGVADVFQDRAQVGLAEAIEQRGWIPVEKLAEAGSVARDFAVRARALECSRVELVVTAPGRQAVNADDLLVALQRGAGIAPRVLSAEEEGRLAFAGASSTWDGDGVLAVCDVGGGSTELAVGDPAQGRPWVASLDIGSLRLTARCLGAEGAGKRRVRRARDEVRALLRGVEPPAAPAGAMAVGGSARALRKLIGGDLDEDDMAGAVELLTGRSPAKIARQHGVSERRAVTLLAGAVILDEVRAHLGLPMVVARAGLREGLAGELLAAPAAA